MPSQHPQHLAPSKLGTKEYWDTLYTAEITNHAADPSDIGTVWFDDSDAEAKTLQFLAGIPLLDPGRASILDLGCGNGSLLFSLRDYGEEEENDDDEGSDDEDEDGDQHKDRRKDNKTERKPWTGRMLGVDYSPQSISLANQILTTSSSSTPSKNRQEISFHEWDLLAGPYPTVLNGAQATGWDVVHDKGTFDAISLSDAQDAQGRRICEGYRGRVVRLVRKGGFFIVTSCNWTEQELKAWFETAEEREGQEQTQGEEEGRFVLDGRVEYRTFSYGGVKGQTVTTLCFRRV